MSNLYDHHSIPHPVYHHPHRHVGHPVHPHHHRHPPHPHPHHMHHAHPHPGMSARPPLANKAIHANVPTYDAQAHHWQKPPMTTVVQKPAQPPGLPPQLAMEQQSVQASAALLPAHMKQESTTPQLSKTQQQHLAAKRQVKTPITLCFERMLGAGTPLRK